MPESVPKGTWRDAGARPPLAQPATVSVPAYKEAELRKLKAGSTTTD